MGNTQFVRLLNVGVPLSTIRFAKLAESKGEEYVCGVASWLEDAFCTALRKGSTT